MTGNQPRDPGIDPDGASPGLAFDFEQHLVVNSRDPSVRRLVVGEALVGLGQERVADFLQRSVGSRSRLWLTNETSPRTGPRLIQRSPDVVDPDYPPSPIVQKTRYRPGPQTRRPLLIGER
jgi:hypothetical protein